MGKAYFGKKKIALLLAAGLLCTVLPDTGAYADRVHEDFDSMEMAAQPETVFKEEPSLYRLVKKGQPSASGYQEMVWVDEEGKEIGGEFSFEESGQSLYRMEKTGFPSSYSLADRNELPAVRNQGQWGTCWAHAAICSIESNMIKKGLADSADADYSERHLSYFAHRRDESLGDGENNYSQDYKWYGGGNYYQARAVLSNGYGAAAERDYPYASYGEMDDLSEADRRASVCQMTDAVVLQTPEDVKKAVMDTGAVMCSFYTGSGTIDSATDKVFHKDPHQTDHAVAIAGWDDQYARTEFQDQGVQPNADGAWLCRNSWGENWAEDGYFWISYEDATLTEFCSFRAEPSDYFDHIYTYDGALSLGSITYPKGANIFTAEAAEELRAVSFPAYKNYDYCIRIYTEGETDMQLPSDGLPVYSQEGTLDYPGYHTVLLEEPVPLTQGMKYAVSLELFSKDEEAPHIYFEYGTQYSSESGQSFFYTGTGWRDTKELGSDYHNICIKAFTNNRNQADLSHLQKLIEEAETLQEEDYTKKTWTNLQTELQKAKAVCQKPNASDTEKIKVILSLRAARESLAPSRIAISNEEEFLAFAQSVSNGESYQDQTVYLTNDLDLAGIVHRRIGDVDHPFEGTFDGCGYEIRHPEYEYGYSYGGLFGYIGENGSVEHVTVKDGVFRLGSSYCGSLAGMNEGTIRDCTVEGDVSFDTEYTAIGGLVGYNNGQIEGCSFNGSIRFENQKKASDYGGGIVGYNNGSVLKCITRGEITSDSAGAVGGIVGYSSAASGVSMCYNLAEITGSPVTETKAAGIGVWLYGNTDSCYNYGNILRKSGEETGAVYCYRSGTLSNCYYLDTSCKNGGYSPSDTAVSLPEEDFASAKAAYELNTYGGTVENSRLWSQADGLPVWSDEEQKGVIKVTVSQNPGNDGSPSIRGITEGVFYEKGGETVSLKIDEQIPGYLWQAEAAGLSPAGQEETVYALPEVDTVVVITCRKKCINYGIQYHLNGGTGDTAETYTVENDVILPTPSKIKGKFLGWYDNEAFLGEPVSRIAPGMTGEKEFWAKWEHLGYEIFFPSESEYEIVPLAGYVNGKIPEDGSFQFRIEPASGYDSSGVTVRNGDAEVIGENGVYRLEHIMSDLNISIEGMKLEAGKYAAKGDSRGESVVLVPILPAVGIKLEGDAEFSQSVTVNRNQEISIVTCDSKGRTSDAELCDFDHIKTRIDLPVLGMAEVADGSQTAAGVTALGEKELPTSGVIQVNGMELAYRIVWNQNNTIDLTTAGNTMEFTGTVVFDNVPEWVILPEDLTITRKITVKKQDPAPILKEGAQQIAENGRYRVLNAEKRTAVLVEVVNKKATKLNVLDEVAINGITCRVVEIEKDAGKNCKKLKKLIVGRNVVTIGKNAFLNCRKLKTIQVNGTSLKTIQKSALKKTANPIKIKAPNMNKKQKKSLLKKMKKAGAGKKSTIK